MKHIQLIKPFAPDEAMDWHDVSLAVNSRWEHTDVRADVEFRRFIHRDFALGAIYPLTVVGILCAPLLTDTGYYGIVNYVISAVTLVLTVLEYYNHIFQENTAQVSLLRRRSQIILALGICLGCTVATFDGYYNSCASSFKLFELVGLPRPELTPERVATYCQQIMNPFATIILSILVTFALTPTLLLVVVCFLWACLVGTRLSVPHTPTESAEDIVVYMVMTGTLSIISLAMLLKRYVGQLQQFGQAVQVVRENVTARRQEEELDLLLCSMLPSSALTRLTVGQDVSDFSPEATVLFSDIVSFTAWSSSRTPREVASMLNTLISDFDTAAQSKGVEKVKTIGDAYWAFTGLPEIDPAHAVKMCEFALEMLATLSKENEFHPEWSNVNIRIGIHSGPLNGAILGTQQLSYEVFGETNDVASKAEQNGMPMRVAMTLEVLDALSLSEDGFESTSGRGMHQKAMDHKGKKYQLFCCTRGVLAAQLQVSLQDASFAPPVTVNVSLAPSEQVAHQPLVPPPAMARGSPTPPSSEPLSPILAVSAPFSDPRPPRQGPLSDFTSFDPMGEHRRESGGGCLVTPFSPGGSLSDSSRTGSVIYKNPEPQSSMRSNPLRVSFSNPNPGLSPLRENTSSSQMSTMEIKAKRKQFLQDRVKAAKQQRIEAMQSSVYSVGSADSGDQDYTHLQDEEEDGQSASIDSLRAQISERRYNWFLFEFKRLDVEERYQTFVSGKQRPLRQASRLSSIGLVVAIFICTAINHVQYSVISVVLLALAVAMNIIDCLLCFFSPTLFSQVSVVLHHCSALLLFLGAGLMNEATPRSGASSPSTNDITYLHAIVSFIVSVGNVGLAPSAVLVVSNLGLFVPVVLALIWKTVMLTLDFVFLFLSNIAFAFALVILERQYRQMYLDEQVAHHFTKLQVKRNTEQRALLSSMVPPHVIAPLMQWLAVDLDPSCAYVRTWEKTCVAFVRVSPLTKSITNPIGRRKSTSSLGSQGFQRRMSVIGEETLTEASEAAQWLLPLHHDVDLLLKKYKLAIKIKTMGDTIMMAGPFRSEAEEQNTSAAADQPLGWQGSVAPSYVDPAVDADADAQLWRCQDEMLAACAEISTLAEVQAGLHVGEVAGAVMGNNRLCFDLFGDTINVASRTMTVGCANLTSSDSEGGAKIIVSESFYSAFKRRGDTRIGQQLQQQREEEEVGSLGAGYHLAEEEENVRLGKGSDGAAAAPSHHCYCPHVGSEKMQFSEKVCRRAKGKGELELRAVQSLSVDFGSEESSLDVFLAPASDAVATTLLGASDLVV